MPIPYEDLKQGRIKVMTIGLTAEGNPGLMQFFKETKYLDLTDDEFSEEFDRVDPDEKLEALVVFQVTKVVYRIKEKPLTEV